MERVETDLDRSKSAREKITRDAAHHIEEIRTKHSREVADIHSSFDNLDINLSFQLSDTKLHYKQDKAVLVQQRQTELESIARDRERERVSQEAVGVSRCL